MAADRTELFPPNWTKADLFKIAASTPMQVLDWRRLDRCGITLSVKREDLLHPVLGGNKFYKLFGHLKDYLASQKNIPLASFGGAWSNHLYALAAACKELKLPSIGVIRGEQAVELSPTLKDVKAMGMHLIFVSREDYRRRFSPDFHIQIEKTHGSCYWIPEGGGGVRGGWGCRAITEGVVNLSARPPDVICQAVGTGTTLAGIASALAPGMQALGISVLKGSGTLQREVTSLVESLGGCRGEWQLNTDFHCGGYAKFPTYLYDFMKQFESETGVSLDPVYTVKLFWAITSLAESGFWPSGTHVVAIHSGGLQGRRGYQC